MTTNAISGKRRFEFEQMKVNDTIVGNLHR